MSNSDRLLQRDGDTYRAETMYLLYESLAISRELGMRSLMERVLSRREILRCAGLPFCDGGSHAPCRAVKIITEFQAIDQLDESAFIGGVRHGRKKSDHTPGSIA